MKNLKELPKETQKLIVAAFGIGWNEGSINCMSSVKMNDEQILEYLQDIINPQEENCHITLIDSVS